VKPPGLDPDTAERMLCGEPTGPPELVRLLAAASSDRAAEQPKGEDAAVAAFLRARSLPAEQPRRLSASVSLKAALIGLLLVLSGGVTVAVTSQHLPGPLGDTHTHRTRTPTPPDTIQTRPPASASSGPAPRRNHKQQTPTPRGTPSTDSSQSAGLGISTGPLPTTAVPKIPDPAKSLKGKGPKTPKVNLPNAPEVKVPGSATR
jgi:hypothetical protein